jgi:hypothetical protein
MHRLAATPQTDGHTHRIKRPECIFNCDETGLMFSQGAKFVFCNKKDKNVSVMVNDN